MSDAADVARYVFGVAQHGAELPQVDPHPLCDVLELVHAGDLTALTGRASRHDFEGPAAEDPSWVLPRAAAHDRVLLAWTLTCSVVPYRFGALFADDGVHRHLQANADRLLATIAALDGAVEYDLCLRADPDQARDAGRRGSGRDYLRARGRQLSGADLDRARDRAEALLAQLGGRTQPLAARAQEVRLACLVPRRHARQAVEAMEAIDADAGAGVAVAVTGPHPAYHFAASTGPAR